MSENDARQALASAAVSPRLRDVLAAPATDPVIAAGQLWRIRIDDTAALVLTVSAVDGINVDVAAVTVASESPADSAIRTLRVPTRVLRQAIAWPSVRRTVPLRAFDVLLDAGEHLAGTARELLRAEPGEVDPLDPGLLLHAELDDDLEQMAASPALPVDKATGALKDHLPGDGASQLRAVRGTLGVAQHEAMALLRGTRSLSPDQAAALEAAFRLDAGALEVTDGFARDVVVELDQPRHKAVIVALAERRRCSEFDIRREAAQRERALAARTTAGSDLTARVGYVLGQMQ